MVIEASQATVLAGHDVTLALLYGKPTLILSRSEDYSRYIHHQLLMGGQYDSKADLEKLLQAFLKKAESYLQGEEVLQTVEAAADPLHAATLAEKRQRALHAEGVFGRWAALAEKDQKQARAAIEQELGDLPIEAPWSVLGRVYNQDTPDYVFAGVARFIQKIFEAHGIIPTDQIVDALGGTGALSRNLVDLGYEQVLLFDNSRERLAEAYKLSSHIPEIKIVEASIDSFQPLKQVRGMAWVDYTSNFAQDEATLCRWLQHCIDVLDKDGVLVFDIRTLTGWRVKFFHEEVALIATDTIQRISINDADETTKKIVLDRYVRVKENEQWGEWRREKMEERMWTLNEVKKVVSRLSDCELEGIYGDDFAELKDDEEPGLAYFVIKKR